MANLVASSTEKQVWGRSRISVCGIWRDLWDIQVEISMGQFHICVLKSGTGWEHKFGGHLLLIIKAMGTDVTVVD